jgi:hypothetical protein
MHEFCHEKLVNPRICEYIRAKEKCDNSNNVMVLPVREGNDDDNDNELQLLEEEIDEDFNQHKVKYLQQFGLMVSSRVMISKIVTNLVFQSKLKKL